MGSTVCYEMMKLCTGSVQHSNGWYLVVLNQYKVVLVNSGWYWVNIGNVCLYILKKWISGQVTLILHRFTDRQTLRERATQLLSFLEVGVELS